VYKLVQFLRLFRLFRKRNSGERFGVITTSLLVEYRLQGGYFGGFTNRRVLPGATDQFRSCLPQVNIARIS